MLPKRSLLYVYPWMPFPRRVTIYLREKHISSALVTVVPVSDPQKGNAVPLDFPPRPAGSLPILAIPVDDDSEKDGYIFIRQSIAIINYLEDLCDDGADGYPQSTYPMRGLGALGRARQTELLALADECTIAWNPVRIFGTGAGTMALPAASEEMLRWIQRSLATIEGWWCDRDFSELRKGGNYSPTIAEIVLFQFLEFTKDCYGRDMTQGSGSQLRDVYDRVVVESYPKLGEFFAAFKTRDSACRDGPMEVASSEFLKLMQTWHSI